MEQTILVPLDHSEITKELIRIADEWTQRTKAQLYFLNVGTKKELESKEQHPLFEKFLKQANISSSYKAVYRSGTPYTEIIEFADEINPDLIVVGAHSHSTIGRLFLGSNTDHIIHHASCPVYVYKQQQMFFENKIIVPIDYTAINQPIIEIADEWAQRNGAEIYFIQVGTTLDPEEQKYMQDHQIRGEQVFSHYIKDRNIKAKHQWDYFYTGKPYEKILEYQKQHNAGLIMMAAHSHTTLNRLLTGSNTDYLLHHTNCPMYVYKEKE